MLFFLYFIKLQCGSKKKTRKRLRKTKPYWNDELSTLWRTKKNCFLRLITNTVGNFTGLTFFLHRKLLIHVWDILNENIELNSPLILKRPTQVTIGDSRRNWKRLAPKKKNITHGVLQWRWRYYIQSGNKTSPNYTITPIMILILSFIINLLNRNKL